MTLTLDDYIDVPTSGLIDKTNIASVPINPQTTTVPDVPKQQVKTVHFRDRDTLDVGRRIVKNTSTSTEYELLDGTIDPNTGKINVVPNSAKKVPMNKSTMIDDGMNVVKKTIQGSKRSQAPMDVNAISEDDIALLSIAEEHGSLDNIPEMEALTLDPLQSSMEAAMKEDMDKSTRQLRQRLVIKVDRFLKTPSLVDRFNHAIVPDCYKQLGIEMLNEILDQIRDSIGRYGKSWGKSLLTQLPVLVAKGVNSIPNTTIGIDENKYINDLGKDEDYIATVDEIDIDYFETSYKNPFIRLGGSLITNAMTAVIKKELPPQQVQGETADSIIASSGTSKTRRPIQE